MGSAALSIPCDQATKANLRLPIDERLRLTSWPLPVPTRRGQRRLRGLVGSGRADPTDLADIRRGLGLCREIIATDALAPEIAAENFPGPGLQGPDLDTHIRRTV